MIDYQQFCQIKQLHHQDGLHAWQIAAQLALACLVALVAAIRSTWSP